MPPIAWYLAPILGIFDMPLTAGHGQTRDVAVQGGDGSNGWTLENSVGSDAFKVEADKDDDGSYETVLTTTADFHESSLY